jgi:hypothetical protein
MTITQLLQPQNGTGRVSALRLIELTDRTSAVMRSSAAETLLQTDPLIGVVRTLGELNGFIVKAGLAVVPAEQFAEQVDEHVQDTASDLVLVSWGAPRTRPQGDTTSPEVPVVKEPTTNPFASLFASAEPRTRITDANFVRGLFAKSSTDVALYVDPGLSPTDGPVPVPTNKKHFVLPFVGGPDDRLALELVIQLCAASADATALVVRLHKTDSIVPVEGDGATPKIDKPPVALLGVDQDKPTVTSVSSSTPVLVYRHLTPPRRAKYSTRFMTE